MMPTNVTIRYHRVLFTPRPRAAHLPFHPPISTSPPSSPTPAPLAPFPRHPSLSRQFPTSEISIYVLPSNSGRARVGPTEFLRRLRGTKTLNSLCTPLPLLVYPQPHLLELSPASTPV